MNHATATPTSILALPDEIMMQIFGKLNVRDTLSVGQVCKIWNSIHNDDHLWEPLVKCEQERSLALSTFSILLPGDRTNRQICQRVFEHNERISKLIKG